MAVTGTALAWLRAGLVFRDVLRILNKTPCLPLKVWEVISVLSVGWGLKLRHFRRALSVQNPSTLLNRDLIISQGVLK